MAELNNPGCEDCAFFSPEGLKKLGINVDNCDYVVALAGNPNSYPVLHSTLHLYRAAIPGNPRPVGDGRV